MFDRFRPPFSFNEILFELKFHLVVLQKFLLCFREKVIGNLLEGRDSK